MHAVRILSPRPVDVNAVIAGMGELLQRSLGGLVQVVTDLASDLWPATSDPTQLELVVLNLAINARDAMADGGQLRIATGNVDRHEAARLAALEPGDYVRIAVIDNGIGMTSDVLEHALEPFFTTKAIGKGSGLGLARSTAWRRSSVARCGLPANPARALRWRSTCRGPWRRKRHRSTRAAGHLHAEWCGHRSGGR